MGWGGGGGVGEPLKRAERENGRQSSSDSETEKNIAFAGSFLDPMVTVEWLAVREHTFDGLSLCAGHEVGLEPPCLESGHQLHGEKQWMRAAVLVFSQENLVGLQVIQDARLDGSDLPWLIQPESSAVLLEIKSHPEHSYVGVSSTLCRLTYQ